MMEHGYRLWVAAWVLLSRTRNSASCDSNYVCWWQSSMRLTEIKKFSLDFL